MGSSGWSPGLWQGWNSPGNARFVRPCSTSPHYFRNSDDKLCHKCDQGEGDWHPANALGKCLSGPSPVSMKGCSHGGRWPNCWEFKLGWIRQKSPHQEYRDHVIIAKAGTGHTSERINVRPRLYTLRMVPYCRAWQYKCLYQAEKGEQECHHGSEKQHGLSPDPKEEDPSSKGSHGYLGTRAPCENLLDRGAGREPQPSNAQLNCEAKAREVVWGIRSEWFGVLATWAGSFHPVSLGWVPWHLLTGAKKTWLYPYQLHMWLKLPMIPHSKNDLDGYLCPSKWRFWSIYEKYWTQVLFNPARAHGVMQWC